uniref:phage major capsid protein n=1 Tax=Ferrovum sp. TaxID=2609467 RepID=UPI002617A602
EAKAFEGYKTRIESLNAAIEREHTLIAEEAQLGIESALPSITVTENVTSDPKGGFKNFGEYAYAVHQAGLPGLPVDVRLSMLRNAAAPGLYGSESAGADGGFLIPPQFAKDIFQLSPDDEAFLPLTDNIEVSGNSLVLPKDETTPWGTDGITVAWQGEGTAAIPKDSGQATNTLTPTNLANMIAALPSGSFKKAVWIVNNSVLPALFTRTLGNYPIYLPLGGGVAAFSSQGDVLLVDLTYYQTITKVGGLQCQGAMHFGGMRSRNSPLFGR